MSEKSICLQVEDLIQESLDRRIDPRNDQRISAHVADCSDCAESLAQFMWLEQAMDTLYPISALDSASTCDLYNNHKIEFLGHAASTEMSQGEQADFPIAQSVSAAPSRQFVSWQTLLGALAASILAIFVFEGQFSMPERSIEVAVRVPIAVPKELNNTAPLDLALSNKNNGSGYVQTNPALMSYYELTSELPGIRPLRCSIDASYQVIQSWLSPDAREDNRSESNRPNVGAWKPETTCFA
ncbi:MAG: zf-HC2 domain-containing protein [Pirellulaceae bacterium]